MSKAAEALGLSPAEVRRRNAYRIGDTTPTGQVLRESVAAETVLARAVEASGFEAVRTRTGPPGNVWVERRPESGPGAG